MSKAMETISSDTAGHLSHINPVKIMTLLSTSSHSSVDRVPAWCSGGHGFDSCRGLRFCPMLMSVHFSQILCCRYTTVKLFTVIFIAYILNYVWPRSLGSAGNSNIHPAVIKLGVQYAKGIICGSNARCVALLLAFRKVRMLT